MIFTRSGHANCRFNLLSAELGHGKRIKQVIYKAYQILKNKIKLEEGSYWSGRIGSPNVRAISFASAYIESMLGDTKLLSCPHKEGEPLYRYKVIRDKIEGAK